MVRVVGYVRVSRRGGREGDRFISPDLQREQISSLAKRDGLEVVEVIEELDASGGDSRRPGWNRAIEMCERGEVAGVAVWNFARFSRSVSDASRALERIEGAGARVYSATENFGDDPAGRMVRTIFFAIAENERERAKAGFRAATLSALERGVFVGGRVPTGYVRDGDRRLAIDPDTAPVVQGIFERRAQGWSWARLAEWATEQGVELTDKGAVYMVRNPTYTGQLRSGRDVREDAHPALVTRALWNRCQKKGTRSARTGKLTEKYLLQGLAECAACGRALYLTTGGRNGTPFYTCRNPRCDERAYAQAARLDAYVLNAVEEELTGLDYDGVRTGPGRGERATRAARWVPQLGDDREIEGAEAAFEEARSDLEGFLADTKLRAVIGAERHAEAAGNYVAALNSAEAALAEARNRHSGGWELVGRLWNSEWGWHERREWLSRMVESVIIRKGRQPLSERAEVALRT